METQWFPVCRRPLAPKSKMYHILEGVWAHFQRTKMTLSHTFCVNKMGKIKVTLKYCQFFPPLSSLNEAFPNIVLWIHYGQRWCYFLLPFMRKGRKLQVSGTSWKQMKEQANFCLLQFGCVPGLRRNRLGWPHNFPSSNMILYIFTLNWTRISTSCFEHLCN